MVCAINWFRNNLPFISLTISTIDINAAIVTTADGGVPNLHSSLAYFIAGPVPNEDDCDDDDCDDDDDDDCDDDDDDDCDDDDDDCDGDDDCSDNTNTITH